MNNLLMLIALFAGVLALAYAALNFFLVRKLKEGTNTKSSLSSAAPSP